MTDQEINLVIAEACPTVAGVWSDGELRWDSKLRPVPTCFDPVNDLNAMHEAEKFLSRGEGYNQRGGFGLYKTALAEVCDEQHPIDATARQRAEAFLRTLGKWKE